MILTLGSYNLALGMDWALALSKGEVRSHMKEMGKGPVVALPNAEGQFIVGHYPHQRPKKAYAGAALLGLVTPDAIICQAVSEEYSWICVLQHGMPVPHQEQLCSREEARDQVRNLLSLHRHPLYGDASGAAGAVEELLDRLRQAVADKTIKRQALKATELRPQGISAGSVLTALLMAGLGVGGVFGFKEWQKWQIQQKARAINAEQSRRANMTAEQLEAEKRRLIAKFREEVAARRAEVSASTVPGQPGYFLAAATGVRRELPLSKQGYFPTSIKCLPGECLVTWEGQGRWVLASHKQYITGQPAVDTALTAVTKMSLNLPSVKGEPLIATSADALRLRMIEALARIPGASVDASQPIIVTPPPNLGLQPVTVGYAGQLRIAPPSRAGLISIREAVDILNRFPTSLSSIEFNGMRTNLAVVLEGSYVLPLTE